MRWFFVVGTAHEASTPPLMFRQFVKKEKGTLVVCAHYESHLHKVESSTARIAKRVGDTTQGDLHHLVSFPFVTRPILRHGPRASTLLCLHHQARNTSLSTLTLILLSPHCHHLSVLSPREP